jgi:hypothetical protein
MAKKTHHKLQTPIPNPVQPLGHQRGSFSAAILASRPQGITLHSVKKKIVCGKWKWLFNSAKRERYPIIKKIILYDG